MERRKGGEGEDEAVEMTSDENGSSLIRRVEGGLSL